LPGISASGALTDVVAGSVTSSVASASESFSVLEISKMAISAGPLHTVVVVAVLALATFGHAQVTTAFGRTGVVIATTGDYTADQVTNAVDSTAAYSNPNWITSLAWSKILGAPPIIISGADNLAFGTDSFTNNTNGGSDTALGKGAMHSNTSGGNNIAVGTFSLYHNATGNSNTAIGHVALYSNTSGNANTAVGDNALLQNTTGQSNTAVGFFSAQNVTTGLGNTAVGESALNAVTTGTDNTAVGHRAIFMGMGKRNTSVGKDSQCCGSLYFDDTGIGHDAMGGLDWENYLNDVFINTNFTGSGNTALGRSSLVGITTGNNNTVAGMLAGGSFSSGSNNVAVGFQAGVTAVDANRNTSGANNTWIGYNSGPGSATQLTNSTAIGSNALVSSSNALVLGGTGQFAVKVGIGTTTPANVFTIGQGAGPAISDGWSTYSSRRWKTNIQTLDHALEKVLKLQGVSYDVIGTHQHQIGVIAEEVGAIIPEVVTWNADAKTAEGVDYARLTALLIEATKQQQTMIEQQQKHIKDQESQIVQLADQVRQIRAALEAEGVTSGSGPKK
jgi:hypothetical protein